MIFATALTDDGIADCYAMPAYRPLFAAIAREVLAVAQPGVDARALRRLRPGAFLPGVPRDVTERSLDAMVAFNRRSAKTHSGVWRDLAVRKRKTEGEAQLGPIPLQAAALGMGGAAGGAHPRAGARGRGGAPRALARQPRRARGAADGRSRRRRGRSGRDPAGGAS
jgi:hypothetical protein